MNRLKGMTKIFRFTFQQQVAAKGYRTAVIIGMLICLLLPAIVMSVMELFGDDDTASEQMQTTAAETIYTVDLTEPAIEDFDFLEMYAFAPFDRLRYVSCENLEEAKAAAAEDESGLVLVLDENQSGYLLSVLLPDETSLTRDDADAVESFLSGCSQAILLQKSGLDISQLGELMTPVQTGVYAEEDTIVPEVGNTETDGVGTDGVGTDEESAEVQENALDIGVVKEILTYVLTFLNIMVIYFLILFYGQSVANHVVMEKTSKLMDTFLIAVRPEAMVFGKVLAVATGSILQFALWLAALAGGFGLGSVLVRVINPESDMMILGIFDFFGETSGIFSIPGMLVALLIVIAGFFLYCSLAAIGGAMASKTEDLASTNALFSLVLVISFFIVLYSGGVDSLGTSNITWQNWIPFMSILVTPARVLLGQTSVPEGLLSLAITVAVTAVLLYIAGRVYKMMALYRGKVPKLGQVLRMLKE